MGTLILLCVLFLAFCLLGIFIGCRLTQFLKDDDDE